MYVLAYVYVYVHAYVYVYVCFHVLLSVCVHDCCCVGELGFSSPMDSCNFHLVPSWY